MVASYLEHSRSDPYQQQQARKRIGEEVELKLLELSSLDF